MPNGRPMQRRSLEIKDALEGKQADETVAFDLEPQEIEQFSRFSQRCRTVARSLGMQISVKTDRQDKTKAYVVIRKTGLDPHAQKPKRGKRGRPRKDEIAQEEQQEAQETTPSYDPAPSAGAPEPEPEPAPAPEDSLVMDSVETVTFTNDAEDKSVEELLEQAIEEEISAPCVALGVTGSVSAYKAPEIVRGLQKAGCDVAVAMTPAAEKFVGQATFAALTDLPVAADLFDWSVSQLPHIDLAEWADLICIAPASANTLAKIAHGMADDCVSATVLAATSKVMVCPAMNVHMWNNPATQANVAMLKERGIIVLDPTEGYLVCGDWGEGKLAPVEEIVRACVNELPSHD